MEGPLSKWTNVMKGWQYRWFVLDDGSGLLSYYTSKEKMMRGARRGCVRLKGAVVGIDDDDDSTFTITVDAKTFHFQGHDHVEREKWLRALEDTILRHAAAQRRWDPNQPLPTMADFDRKLTESDAYLQILIEQSKKLELQSLATDDPNNKARCQIILGNLNQILESIKHCIVLLQIAKNTAFPMNGVYHPCNAVPDPMFPPEKIDRVSDFLMVAPVPLGHRVQTGIEVGNECAEELCLTTGNKILNRHDITVSGVACVVPPRPVPDMSYSSSEEEDFYDASDFHGSTSGPRLFEDSPGTSPSDGTKTSTEDRTLVETSAASHKRLSYGTTIDRPASQSIEDPSSRHSSIVTPYEASNKETIPESDSLRKSEPTIDYDAMYEEGDEELGSLEGHGSVIQHLISQVKIGMDLTKVVLPTFILERRSLLEMYADFFAHPDLFCSIADFSDPRDRMVQVLKWYMSAFHAGRKSEVARKPYNPILGEVFRCYWDLSEEDTKSTEVDPQGPVPWATTSQLGFVAEQVSHHPPVSAFYAEHKKKRISFCGHIWTKSKFLGLSVCVNNIGQGCVSLLDRDEEYIVNFPSGYGRSILTVPWVELGGACQITCSKTGYNATIEFLTKPFYGGKKHKINAEVTSPGEKKPFLVVEGEWNGNMTAKWNDGRMESFVDTVTIPIMRKKVKSIAEQEQNESRFLWKDVTAGLKLNNINEATGAKFSLEQKQREEAKQRKELCETWQTKLFSLEGENWVYNKPLQKRQTE